MSAVDMNMMMIETDQEDENRQMEASYSNGEHTQQQSQDETQLEQNAPQQAESDATNQSSYNSSSNNNNNSTENTPSNINNSTNPNQPSTSTSISTDKSPVTPSIDSRPGGQSSLPPPNLTPGQAPTPIQPYYPYFPMPMTGYMTPNHAPADPLFTGTETNPYHYNDVSNVSDPMPDTRRNRGGVTEPFPQKLHRMLDATAREGLSSVVGFFSHGRAFAIHKPRRFVAEIMPRFFKQTRLTSFQRQLNLYGFRRISQGPDNGGYYHELFLRGRPGLCVNMKRTKVKGHNKFRRDPESEPDFYSFPPLKPLESGTKAPANLPPPNAGISSVAGGVSPAPPPTNASPQPPQVAFPGYYSYPPPPYMTYPLPPNTGPYTASQQPSPPPAGYAVPVYPFTAGWYPHPPSHSGHMPATSPVAKKGNDSKTIGVSEDNDEIPTPKQGYVEMV